LVEWYLDPTMKKKSVQPPLDNNPPYLEEIAEQQQQKEKTMGVTSL